MEQYDLLHEYVSKQQILELLYAYAWHAANGEADEMARLFTEDGAFRTAGRVIRGREALADFYRTGIVSGDSVPMVLNPLIVVSGDTAHGRSVMMTPFKGSGPGFCGHYRESFACVDRRWRFTDRLWTAITPSAA
jgi:SnoaL-like domain